LGDYKANFKSGASTVDTIDGNLTALTLAPKFNWHLNDSWNLFAKIGGAYMMSEDEKDFVATGSLGAEYSIDRNWSVRAEYQRYQDMSDDVIEDMDSDFFGIGFNYKFGSEPVVQEKAVEEVVEARPATRIVDHVYPAQTTA
ncbi:porin family protein, partial [Escherichia coli]|nr:porin family protein [Escherichia coli]